MPQTPTTDFNRILLVKALDVLGWSTADFNNGTVSGVAAANADDSLRVFFYEDTNRNCYAQAAAGFYEEAVTVPLPNLTSETTHDFLLTAKEKYFS